MLKTRIIMMAKTPCAGSVKSRLGNEIGFARAANLQRHWIGIILRTLHRRLPSRWFSIQVARTPIRHAADRFWRRLNSKTSLCVQCHGGLGSRIWQLIGNPAPCAVLVLGSDIPDVTGGNISTVVRALRVSDVAIGPSADGGFWCIGVGPRRSRVRLGAGPIASVRWSGRSTRSDTCRLLRRRALRVRSDLPWINDIDTGEDLADHTLEKYRTRNRS